jgi:hypothetical protein
LWRVSGVAVGGGFQDGYIGASEFTLYICLYMWAMLQRRHDRRRLFQQSEVRATSAAPFDVKEGSWPLRKRSHVHANLLGGLTGGVALDHHYRSTGFLSMTLTMSTGAFDVSSCVRLRDLASNRAGPAMGRDNRSTPLAFFHVTTGSVRRVCDVLPCICLRDLMWNCGGRTMGRDHTTSGLCVVPLSVVVVAVTVFVVAELAALAVPARGGVYSGGGCG